ncbi:NAD-dependent epimerase/dehydratase family protein [Bacteroides sp. 214]|uniref:NAD-dependent epimerase/dehydratase family protein n=1 Tax=Bacteroides sp. 214 TaxID=2302935 RepID=UPI0013D60949|nr:NAD-dependent epimerase/dehydratase family protein [Bacteroides sp. 214]NDW11523.1 NAD-dependent epimerase/dehydratase family protein [Bacteroides sp. 214]
MILITGSSGLVGGHLLISLLRKGENVRALLRSSSRLDELRLICHFYNEEFDSIYNKVEWVEGDLLNKTSLLQAMSDVNRVYHCAAVVSFGSSTANTLWDTNVAGTRNMVEAALESSIKSFVFVSSIGALGTAIAGKPVDEETPWNTANVSSVYTNSKYASEQEVWKGIAKGLQAIIVNPGIVLGAGDFTKSSLQLIEQIRKGMPFYTRQKSGYVDVGDVCRAIELLLEKELYNQRFVLVAESLTNKELFTFIARALNKRPPFIAVGKTGLKIACFLNTLLSKVTGKPPLITPEIARSASKQTVYSSDKIINATGFVFTPIEECIKKAVQ